MHCLNKAMHIVSWCNGSTADSGSVCLGSNPSETTKKLIINRLPAFFYLNINNHSSFSKLDSTYSLGDIP